jgi:hypothetical protein
LTFWDKKNISIYECCKSIGGSGLCHGPPRFSGAAMNEVGIGPTPFNVQAGSLGHGQADTIRHKTTPYNVIYCLGRHFYVAGNRRLGGVVPANTLNDLKGSGSGDGPV